MVVLAAEEGGGIDPNRPGRGWVQSHVAWLDLLELLAGVCTCGRGMRGSWNKLRVQTSFLFLVLAAVWVWFEDRAWQDDTVQPPASLFFCGIMPPLSP